MERLIMDTKGWVQITSNKTWFSDIWFSGVKTAEEAMAEGVDYCGTGNTRHKSFCLSTFKKCIKDYPEGSYLVIKITSRVTGDRPLMDIGY